MWIARVYIIPLFYYFLQFVLGGCRSGFLTISHLFCGCINMYKANENQELLFLGDLYTLTLPTKFLS